MLAAASIGSGHTGGTGYTGIQQQSFSMPRLSRIIACRRRGLKSGSRWATGDRRSQGVSVSSRGQFLLVLSEGV